MKLIRQSSPIRRAELKSCAIWLYVRHVGVTAILGLVMAAVTGRADIINGAATNSATVQPAGPRASTAFFNMEGDANGANASFGVLEFSAASFGLNFPVISVASSFTVKLTESDAAFTAPGSLNFYFTTDTTTAFSGLTYQSASAPGGVGPQLSPLTLLNTAPLAFTTTGNTATGQVDTYTLTLTSALQTYVANQLNSGGPLRLVVAAATSTTAATFSGSSATAALRPVVSFNATLNQPSLTWTGGSGNWNAPGTAGDTAWSGSGWTSDRTAIFSNTPSGTVTLTAPISATGLTFGATGYTVAGTAANPLTLSGGIMQVTNATDTATVSAVVAGSLGLAKTGAGTLVLSGANTYSGGTTITGGTLTVSNDSSLGAAANGVSLNGGALRTGATLTLGSGRALSGSGTLDMTGGALTVTGDVAASGLTIANGTATFAGTNNNFTTATVNPGSTLAITGGLTGTTRLTFAGGGAVSLPNNNFTFGGGITINPNGPTLNLGTAQSLGTAQFRFNGGGITATSALTGANAITTEFSVGGNVTIGGAFPIEFAASGGFGFFGSTAKTLTINTTVTVNSDIMSSTSTNPNSTLNKAGTGTLILTNVSSYNGGTNITGGIVRVGTDGALGIGDVSVTALPAANVTLRLDNNRAINDLANVILTSNGTQRAQLDLEFTSNVADTNTLEIINGLVLDGVGQAPGIYNATNLPLYITGPGSLMVTTLVVVPEPSTWAMLAVSLGGLAGLKWRRNRQLAARV